MKKPVILAIIAVLLICALAIALFFILANRPEGEAPEDPAPQDAAEPAPEEPEPAPLPEPEPEAPPQEAAPEQPEAFVQLLAEGGYAPEDLSGEQLIIVKSSGNNALVFTYEKGEDGVWSPLVENLAGHTGRNGVRGEEKREGDLCTPAGLFPLVGAFGVEPDPGCHMYYRQATADSYWVDDPDSIYYNRWREGTENKDWNSAEHLVDYPQQYAYAVIIGYNMAPMVPGKGCAIFFHCGTGPTAGCVSVPREDLLSILLWLEEEKSPEIVIF